MARPCCHKACGVMRWQCPVCPIAACLCGGAQNVCDGPLTAPSVLTPKFVQPQTAIGTISGLIPRIFFARVKLLARTERAISAATFRRVLVRKCVALACRS